MMFSNTGKANDAAMIQSQPAAMIQSQPAAMIQSQPAAMIQSQPAAMIQSQPATMIQICMRTTLEQFYSIDDQRLPHVCDFLQNSHLCTLSRFGQECIKYSNQKREQGLIQYFQQAPWLLETDDAELLVSLGMAATMSVELEQSEENKPAEAEAHLLVDSMHLLPVTEPPIQHKHGACLNSFYDQITTELKSFLSTSDEAMIEHYNTHPEGTIPQVANKTPCMYHRTKPNAESHFNRDTCCLFPRWERDFPGCFRSRTLLCAVPLVLTILCLLCSQCCASCARGAVPLVLTVLCLLC
jgi:hypothetical protein